MKECKSCKTQINEKAKKCPNCKADQRNFFLKHKILTAILAFVLLGVVISATGGDDGAVANTSAGDTDQSQKAEEAQTPQQITADQLADEFDANQVAAEKEWKGKLVQFSGEISNITESGVSFYDVGSGEYSMTQISCSISDEDQLVSLKNGEEVTVKGNVDDQMMGVISIKNCSIVK